MAMSEKVAKDPSSVQQRERQLGPLGGGRPVQAQKSSGGRNGLWRGGPERVRSRRSAGT